MFMRIVVLFMLITGLISCTKDGSFESGSQSGGTLSGSYATMLTINNKLYVVNTSEITTFDVSDPKQPRQIDRRNVGVDIESLYHYNGLLLIGSANNMYIYRINADGIPERQSASQYNQVFGDEVCTSDPIVVRDDIAYVTLSAVSTVCRFPRQTNEMRIYDVRDIKNPKMLNTKPMTAPKGLGFGKNHLYVCDEVTGLYIYSLKDPQNPELVKTISGFSGYDLIIDGHLMIIVTPDELLQYDITNETDIKPLGKIEL